MSGGHLLAIFDIAQKDLIQLARDRKIFLFLLVMPIVFTFLFGYAFGGFGPANAENRLPVGYMDQDQSWVSRELLGLLEASQVIRLQYGGGEAELTALTANEDLAAALIIPQGFGREMAHGRLLRLILIGDTSLPAGRSVESEILAAILRLDSALRTAILVEDVSRGQAAFDYSFQKALAAWDDPPIRIERLTSAAPQQMSDASESLAHTSPGMMLQFSIASLLTSAQILVSERKSRSLQRLLTTDTPILTVLLGHWLAIFGLIFGQFLVLISFGQLVLKVNYLSAPLATLLIVFAAALCISMLGLLIGALAKTEEQAVVFSLVPMFVLSGLGGAWVPLEVTGEVFQVVGHLTPLAWAMDGFKNITIRGLGIESAWLPAAALAGYAALFFSLALWKFRGYQA